MDSQSTTARTPREEGRPDRGGTEPLAALVAVAAIAVAVSVYAGFASVVVSQDGTSEVDRATLDSVWSGLVEDGRYNATGPMELDPDRLPRGHNVAVTITLVGEDGRLTTVERATFGTDGEPATLDPPSDAPADDRPVAVRVSDGDVRPGRLSVVVWDD